MQAQDPQGPAEATRILRAAAGGARGEAERLYELLYAELHEQAARAMRGERADHTLQPTALVNEAWIKLFDAEASDYADRRHFLAVSARVMRQVLVDHARGLRRLKRGGDWDRIALEAASGEAGEVGESGGVGDADLDCIALDAALVELGERSPRQAQVVELRFFGGMSNGGVAEVLEVSERTVEREWRFAKAWLSVRLGR